MNLLSLRTHQGDHWFLLVHPPLRDRDIRRIISTRMSKGGAVVTQTDEGPRVWDRFLTEQDKAAAAMGKPRTKGYGSRPALLFIDLYRSVFGDEPQPLLEALKTWPSSCGLAAWEAIPHLQQLLAAARAADIPVIHTTGLETNITQWSRAQRAVYGGEEGDAAAERHARRSQIIDEVAPIPGELVIRKSSPSAFWGTPLIGHLIDRGIDTIIVGGESTSGCVRASVVDGCTNRFRMIVAEECVFDRHETTHAVELFTMNQKYADVRPLRDVLNYLDQLQESKTE
jgi:maleamate amidohydrolase